MLFHYRDRDQLEVDLVIENSAGEIVDIEVPLMGMSNW
jgi:hypothetical protein